MDAPVALLSLIFNSSGASGSPKRYCTPPRFDSQTETSFVPVAQEKTVFSLAVQKDVCGCTLTALTSATVRLFVHSGSPWHSSAMTLPRV